MADVLYFKERSLGGGRVADVATGQQQHAVFGRDVVPARTRVFTHGTGNFQANKWHLSRRTLTATTFDLLDLAGGLTDYKGAAITFATVRRIYVAVVDPDGTKSLRVGPQNQSNAFQGPWGGTGATVYQTVYTDWDDYRPITGHTVTGGSTDIFPVYNPGAGSVTYLLFVLGT